jgi:hypothetical protein
MCTDKFSDFIFPVYSSSYRENRQNGGLTAFRGIESIFTVGQNACRITRRFFTDYYALSPGMLSKIPGKGAAYLTRMHAITRGGI